MGQIAALDARNALAVTRQGDGFEVCTPMLHARVVWCALPCGCANELPRDSYNSKSIFPSELAVTHISTIPYRVGLSQVLQRNHVLHESLVEEAITLLGIRLSYLLVPPCPLRRHPLPLGLRPLFPSLQVSVSIPEGDSLSHLPSISPHGIAHRANGSIQHTEIILLVLREPGVLLCLRQCPISSLNTHALINDT